MAVQHDEPRILGSLSPSRAADFLSCPLMYRFRTVDRLPEASSPDAVRGTLVHKVLEDIFDLPAAGRTREAAHAMLEPAWAAVRAEEPRAAGILDGLDEAAWLESGHTALDQWFGLEDPTRLEPAEREAFIECLLDSGPMLRGVIDRIDVAPDGAVRLVDYKGLARDTPLPTPTGWTTMGAVSVGDLLLGVDGRPTRVTQKSEIHARPCYRVTWTDGSEVTCDNVHLWQVVESHRQVRTSRVMDTDALAARHAELTALGRPHSLWIDAAQPLALPADVDLPIAPWILGAWLGDGHSRGGELSVGALDIDDMLVILKERWPGEVRVRRDTTAFCVVPSKATDQCTYGHSEWLPATPGHPTRRCARSAAHAGDRPSNLSLSAQLRHADLRLNKHIPPAYLRASHEQRLELLRGLMDTDGWWNKARRRAGFTTTDDRLADDVVELVRTLGMKPAHFRKPYANAVRPHRTQHVIEFTPLVNPFHLPRKSMQVDIAVTDLQRDLAQRRTIASVERVASVPTQCVKVDAPDSLYLCGRGFVPTHNTGHSPSPGFESRALFQLRFYGLMIWRTRGVIPKVVQLVYLADSQIVAYEPDEADLLATERKIQAIWSAIREARATGDYQPSPGRNCDWCAHHALCPVFGGTPPPIPERSPSRRLAPPTRWERVLDWLRRAVPRPRARRRPGR